MNRILEIGFRYAGNWTLVSDELQLYLKSYTNSKNVLYAFISNGEIKYIGKTTQPLAKRLYGYMNPGKTQSTNIKNNKNIKGLLSKQEPVDVFVLPDNGLLNYGGFPINLAAGLEDGLIASIDPPWNGGQKESEAVKTQEALSNPSDAPSAELNYSKVFTLELGIAYYNHGFFNVPVKLEGFFASDGDEIEIYTSENENPITGYINRTANRSRSPRIMGGKNLKHWIMSNFKQGEPIEIKIISSNSVRLQRVKS